MSNELQLSKQMSNKVVVVEHQQVIKVPIRWRDAMWVSDLAIDQGALWMHCCPLVNVILCCPWESAVWGCETTCGYIQRHKLMISALSWLLDVGLMRSCSWTRYSRFCPLGQSTDSMSSGSDTSPHAPTPVFKQRKSQEQSRRDLRV